MYKIVGADQKEYGPVPAAQIIQWIQEGRANTHSLARLDEGPWKPLSSFSEFATVLGSSAPPPLPSHIKPVAVPQSKTNPFAITGLILGCLGIFQCCAPLFAISGLVFSLIALVQISRNSSTSVGKSLAIAGLVVSGLGLLLFIYLWATGFFNNLLRYLPELS